MTAKPGRQAGCLQFQLVTVVMYHLFSDLDEQLCAPFVFAIGSQTLGH